MKRKQFLEPGPPRQQQPQGGAHVPDSGGEIGLRESPYLTLAEGARYCRFDDCVVPTAAFRQWLHRQAIPIRRCGRKLLVERKVLDLVLKGV